jgi:uncharacterized protein YndB with AHSA1/START domain
MSGNDERRSRDSGPREEHRFERRLAHPPEKVWRALTDAGELAHWFPASVEGRREKGASLRFVFRDGDEPDAEGKVTEWDPPRLLVYTMGDETLRWELSPLSDGGSLLVLTTTRRSIAPANDNSLAMRMAA